MKITTEQRNDSLTALKAILTPGTTVYTVLRHRSASGMSRSISLHVVDEGGIRDISYHAARAMGYKVDEKNGGLKTSGCGMDMGFKLVYSLGRALFPEGFGVEGDSPVTSSKTRPSNPAEAAGLVSIGFAFHGRNGDASGWDNDGGYALNQRWI